MRGAGGIQISDSTCLALRLSSHPCLCTCEIRKQSEKNFLVQLQNMTNILFIIFGGRGVPGGARRLTQGCQISRTVRPHHIADKSITRDTNNQEFFIYEPQCENKLDMGGGGGLGGGYDWAHLASQLSSHLTQYTCTCKIWKQSDKDILCYLENDAMSADAA